LSIKQFAQLSGVPGSTLRYWDDIGLFKPAKRDEANGYRYYAPEQIIAVNFIKVLSGLGVPLNTIQRLGDERTPEELLALIGEQAEALDQELRQLRESYSIIRTRGELIQMGLKAVDEDEISVVAERERRFVLGQRNDFRPGEGFYRPFTEFCEQALDRRINLQLPVGSMFDDWEGFYKTPGEPHYFLSVDATGNRVKKAGDYLVGYARGYYGQFGDLAERMARYMAEHGLRPTGPVFTMYLLDEICVADQAQYLARVCVAVKKQSMTT